jgi:hypothetical protein
MKKLTLFFAVVVAIVSLSSLVRAAEVKPFLIGKFGWTIEIGKNEKSIFSVSWECEPERAELSGKSYNWVCRQKDSTYWSVILIRAISTDPKKVENAVFKGFTGGRYEPLSINCREEIVSSPADENGIVRDCSVDIRTNPSKNQIFFFSFYHFEKDGLGFTIYVQNGRKIPDPTVNDTLRRIISTITVK